MQPCDEKGTFLIVSGSTGAIIQAKAVLVDDLERMRNDPVDGAMEGKDNIRRVPGVNMPPPEDAAALLRYISE